MRKNKLYFLLPIVFAVLLTACNGVSTENFLEGSNIVISDTSSAGVTDVACDLPYEDWFTRRNGWRLRLDEWFAFDFIITQEAALEIDDAIFRHTFGAENLSDTPATIVENIEENIFIIGRMTSSGEAISVTLDKTDARIVWVHHERELVDVTITPRMAREIGDAALRLVFGESIFEDSAYLVSEFIGDGVFYVWRRPSDDLPPLGSDGEFPLAVIDGANGRIMQVGHG